jgi:hypothetical protein
VNFWPKWQWPLDIAVTKMEMDTIKDHLLSRKDIPIFPFLRNKQTIQKTQHHRK